jgi:hypothetical protein
MEAFETCLSKFKTISPENKDGFRLLNPLVTKYICTTWQLPEILGNITDTFGILEIEGNRILSCQYYFTENVITDTPEIDKDRFCNFGEEYKLFNGYKRIILVSFNEWITVDFCLQHLNNSGRLSSFDSMVVLSVYLNNDPDSSPIIDLLENFVVSDNSYIKYDINLLLLYAIVKLNMPKSKIGILDDLIQ